MFYEKFADSYDDMINWSARLSSEKDSLKNLFKETGTKSILDAGCGTGIHSVLFSKFGLKVVALDNNPSMLEIAQRNIEKYKVSKIKLIEGEFTDVSKTAKGPFDCVACLGNSLPHLVDDDDLIHALKEFRSILKPGGYTLIQMVHFDHYLDSADSAVAVSDGIRNGREVTFRRHYEFKGTKVFFHVSIYSRKHREMLENYSTPLNAIRKDLMVTFMERAGFSDIDVWSNFDKVPVEDQHRSLVFFGRNPEEGE